MTEITIHGVKKSCTICHHKELIEEDCIYCKLFDVAFDTDECVVCVAIKDIPKHVIVDESVEYDIFAESGAC
jgi:hypothetical protein